MQEIHLTPYDTENIQLITSEGHKLYTCGDSLASWVGQKLYMGENWYTEEVVKAHWVDDRIRKERAYDRTRETV